MPVKTTFSELNQSNSALAATVSAALQSQNLTNPPTLPGDPGSWALPNSASGQMDKFGSVMADVHTMADVWAGYGIMQIVVILGLIFR